MIVQTNSTEDQSTENLQVVTDVLSNTVNLLENISVSAEVMMLHILNCVLFCTKFVCAHSVLWFYFVMVHHPNVQIYCNLSWANLFMVFFPRFGGNNSIVTDII